MNSQLKLVAPNSQHKAYEFIKEGVITLRIKPFDRLSAVDLAAQLGVSRTPVREALGRLEQDGLIAREAAGGYYVRPINLKEILDVYRIREALEVEAALEALPNIDDKLLQKLGSLLDQAEILRDPADYAEFLVVNRKFHVAIVEASDNALFEQIMAPIADRVRLVGAILIRLHTPRTQEIFEENLNILEGFRSRDPAVLEAAVRAHVRRAREHASTLLMRDPERLYFDTPR